MKWQDILKADITMRSAARLGREYAMQDMYEAKLISEEEYDDLDDAGKISYHTNIVSYLDTNRRIGNWVPEDELSFHRSMAGRLRTENGLPTAARFYEGYKLEREERAERKKRATAERRERERAEKRAATAERRAKAKAEREKARAEREKARAKTKREEKPVPEPIYVPSLIVDYFTFYRNRGLGIPTLEDISRDEGRLLTTEEIEGYREHRRRMEE